LCQDKSKSIPEEGSQTSDDSVMLKIPDHDPWQNSEVDLLDAHPGEDWITTANKLDINRELEKCHELLRVQYNLNSIYKKEVKITQWYRILFAELIVLQLGKEFTTCNGIRNVTMFTGAYQLFLS
jgi:hypothetical protein